MPKTTRIEEGAGTPGAMLGEHPVFTTADLRDCLPALAGLGTARQVIARWESTGRVIRVRPGLYAAVPAESAGPDLFSPYGYLVACKLAPDAVVSHHGALQFFGCAYSIWSEYVYSATVPRAPFRYATNGYRGTRYPAALLRSGREQWGVVETRRRGGVVRVTCIERTFVDVLSAPRLAGGWEEVWRSLQMVDELDVSQVVEYATFLDNATACAKVGYFLERHRELWPFDDPVLDALRNRKPRRPQHMDRRAGGDLVREWNLIVPHAVAEETWDQFYGYRW
ncbi:MAG: transcriptional regulator [bacterium]|nr:transcriptional regulator [bacterium]MDE0437585.1 transcriptional regulator [bacterium]